MPLDPGFDTTIAMLATRADRSPEVVAFQYQDHPVGYRQLWQQVNRFANFLLALGVRRRESVLLLPNGSEFFTAFYGVQRVAATAVPLVPASGPRRVLELASQCRARVVVPSGAASTRESVAREAGLRLVTIEESADRDQQRETDHASFPTVGPEDRAFVQFTSGSTGSPKGVALTHRALMTNLEQLTRGMRASANDVFVSWLPCYHDMGLIVMTMLPFYLGAGLTLLPTRLRNASSWLGAIERYRGTVTAAPDFAYRLCLRLVAAPEAFDLSSLRVALNAAEPVRTDTVRRFESAFGLDRVMISGYGLAEACVGVITSIPGSALSSAEPGIVSVGRGFEGVEIAIIRGGGRLPAGRVGEIVVRSPANTDRYLDAPEETAALFWGDGYLRTGDLGYLDEAGNLFIVGREKNVILRQGENIGPHEAEACADAVAGVRYSAAVGIDRGDVAGEQVYLFAEVRRELPAEAYPATVRGTANAVHGHLGIPAGEGVSTAVRQPPLHRQRQGAAPTPETALSRRSTAGAGIDPVSRQLSTSHA